MKPKRINNDKERRIEKQEFASKIGNHLRKLREKTEFSQENLSLEAGYYRTYVAKIEQGQYSPSLHTIWRIAHALGMSLDEFFKGF